MSRSLLACDHPPFRVGDLVFIRPADIHNGGASPTESFEGRPLRVDHLRHEIGKPSSLGGPPTHAWKLRVRSLGGTPLPDQEWDSVWFERTAVVSFALDRGDVDGLRELRRVWRTAHLAAPEAWSPCDRSLPALLRKCMTLVLGLWEEEPECWSRVVHENLVEWKTTLAHPTEVLRVRVRMSESVAMRLLRMGSTLGIPMDHLACAALLQQTATVYMDAPVQHELRPEARLAAVAPSALRFYRSPTDPAPPVFDPSTDELPPGPSLEAPKEEDLPGAPARMVSPVVPSNLPPPKPGASASHVLAVRPLKPPGR